MKRNLMMCAAVAVAAVGWACGKGKDEPGTTQGNVLNAEGGQGRKAGEPGELAAPPLGVVAPEAWSYPFGKGEKAFAKAGELAKAKDWPGLQAATEATLAADAGHLDAHWMLALALVAQKKYDAVGEHLAAVLAADVLKYGPELEKSAELAPYLASPQGAKAKQLLADLRVGFAAALKKGSLVVARRAGFRAPAKAGVVPVAPRAELFVLDETGRYLRLTHTGFALAAWLPSPSRDAVAYVSWNKAKLPEAAAGDEPPLLAEARVGVLALGALEAPQREAVFKDVRALAVGYDVGEKLSVETFAPEGRWGLRPAKAFVIDTTEGAAKPAKPPGEGVPRVVVSYDDVVATGPAPEGVEADFRADTAAASSFRLRSTQKTISLPPGESALRGSFVWSPKQARLAFATLADPCADKEADRLSSLYVVEAATGRLKHVDTGTSAWNPRWLDDDQLLYEDDKGGLRVYSAPDGRDTIQRAAKGGLALVGMGAAPLGARICKSKKQPYETPEGAMPPEEPPGAETR
jgi:hypothetical protein